MGEREREIRGRFDKGRFNGSSKTKEIKANREIKQERYREPIGDHPM